MPCLNRHINESLKLPFGDSKHFFYKESACGAGCDGDICEKCLKKSSVHGLVSEPYTAKSHIYGGPWYFKAVGTYGEPSKEYLEIAMEAQKKARGGKRVSGSTVAAIVVSSPDITPKPKVVRRVVKKSILPDTTGVIDTIPSSGLVESTNEPLDVEEVIRIILKPFTYNGVVYWRDEERDKLYLNVKGQKGKYAGRWSGETILMCPDSDDD
jgi:hypothetical protein